MDLPVPRPQPITTVPKSDRLAFTARPPKVSLPPTRRVTRGATAARRAVAAPAPPAIRRPAASPAASPAAKPLIEVRPAGAEDAAALPEASPAEIDGRMVRAALAASLANIVAGRTRPSRLIGGEVQPSLLADGLDSVWDVAERAALGFFIEGKTPGPRELKHQAFAGLAGAAQQEAASLVAGATQYGEDHGIPFLRNLEGSAAWSPGARPSLEVRSIDSLFQTAAAEHTVFLEAGIRTDFEDTTANLGLGYRYQLPDSAWMLGINAFYDRQFPVAHQRMSLGLEASAGDFDAFANRYVALSGWQEKDASFDERPLSGWDVGVAGQVPGLEDLRLSLSAFHWEQKTEEDKTGLKLMADYDVSPSLQLGMTFAADDSGGVQAGVRLSFLLGGDDAGWDEPAPAQPGSRRLAFVNRENIIRTETREVPRGYAISFADAEVTPANETAFRFELTGAPDASSYGYRITSSGGGPALTGSGLVRQSPQLIEGIDVSGLADGTLTFTLRVISKRGAAGPEVTARIVKSTAALGVSTSALSGSPTNMSPIRFKIVFSREVDGLDVSGLDVTNGLAANLATADGIVWTVGVTPLAQGAVTLQVKAGAVTAGGKPNPASNVTAVIFDNEAPGGYGVVFLHGSITAAAFEIRDGEVGATFSFRITSSGGGTPVTGTGTIGAGLQQVTGLDLSGLADGTLTLSVILTDALGNAGQPATATMMKDIAPPIILSVTPPAPGLFNDL